MANARSYYRYLVDTVKTKPLFSVIEMTPTKWWRQLIFMDMYNFGGVEIDSEAEQEEKEDMMTSPPSSPSSDSMSIRVVSEWDISRHLPPLAKRHFEIIVAYFVIRPVQWANKKMQQDQLLDTSFNSLTPATTVTKMDEDEDDQVKNVTSMTSYLHQLVDRDFTDLMHKMSSEILSRRDAEARDFPKLAGSYLNSNNAALEFVKRVCHVLALDTDVTVQVERLKKYLFRLIGQREFSASTFWKNPSLSFVRSACCCYSREAITNFNPLISHEIQSNKLLSRTQVLPDVICSFCNACEKLDLLRNPVLTDTSLDRKSRWRCVHCNNPYNLRAIEMRLVQQLQNSSMAFQLQDLACEKCGEVKGDNLGMYCSCSSKFRNAQESMESYQKRLRVFKNVADFHEFEWLKDTVEWLSR